MTVRTGHFFRAPGKLKGDTLVDFDELVDLLGKALTVTDHLGNKNGNSRRRAVNSLTKFDYFNSLEEKA